MGLFKFKIMKIRYKCPFCGKKHSSKYLMHVCFELDIKEAETTKQNLKPLKTTKNGTDE
jgi:hypothetical protein